MYSLTLPELTIEVFKETGNKNTIKHFLDSAKNIEFDCFETQSNFIIISYKEEKYCLTKDRDNYDNECNYIILVNKKPTTYNLGNKTLRFREWIKHPKLREYSVSDIIKSWENCFTFKEENPQINELGLRKPQIGAIFSILGHLKSSDEIATVVMPTGTGKTETMISVLVANKCEKILIVVPSDSLRTQLFDKFLNCGILKDQRFGIISQSALNPKVGMLKQAILEVNELENFFTNCNVIITTMSLINNLSSECQDKISQMCTHFFIDEAHHAQASSWGSFRRKFESKPIIQFTATPFRNDNQRLEGKIIFNFSLRKAQEQGYFKKINFIPIREYDVSKADKKIADKAVSILKENMANGYNQILMARCGNQKKAESIFRYYKAYTDLNPILIHSNVPNKNKVLEKIKNKIHKIIVCVDMLGEGFDLPELKIAAFHDIRKSLPITLQFAGRFTRSSYDQELGEASFIANIADVGVGEELNELYAQDANWNLLLSSISSREIYEKLDFEKLIEGFGNLNNSSIPFQNIDIALSTVVYKNNSTSSWNPKNFTNGISDFENYDYKFHDINEHEKMLVIINAKKNFIEWGNIKEFYSLEWNIIVVFYDTVNKVLHIHGSDKTGLYKQLAIAIINDSVELISGTDVFKAFYDIKRVTLQNVGLKEFLGKNIRFRMSVGPDVEEALSLTEKQKGQKAFVFGIGYENGEKISLGCSYKGRIWSHSRGNLSQFKNWCIELSQKLTNSNINGNQILKETLIPEAILELPPGVSPIFIDWHEDVYSDKETKFVFKVNNEEFDLSYCELKIKNTLGNSILFDLIINKSSYEIKFSIFKNNSSENPFADHKFENNSGHAIYVQISSRKVVAINEFFINYTPTIWFADGSALTGNQFVKLQQQIRPYPKELLIDDWDWNNIDIAKESQGTDGKITDSIQFKALEILKKQDFDIIYNDDGPGEIADIVTMRLFDDKMKINMYHLKYAHKGQVSSRIDNFYEVCGQAQKSIHWKHKKSQEFFEHLIKRETKSLKNNCSRLEKGAMADLERYLEIAKKIIPIEFEMFIVQPGTTKTKISDEILTLLAVTENYIKEMSNIKLNIIINKD